MDEVAQEEALLQWFYPDRLLHLHQREEALNVTILEGMRTGVYKYTRDPENTSYTKLSSHKVTLESMIDDLCTARLVFFGKHIEDAGAVKSEQDILKALVPSLVNKSIIPALPSGNHSTMGGMDGLTIEDTLNDARLKPEVDAYLRETIRILNPVICDTVFFPDNKCVIGNEGSKPLLEMFQNKGWVYPIERARQMAENLRDFFGQLTARDAIYFFGSNLWTINQLGYNFMNMLKILDDVPIRMVSQDPFRIALTNRDRAVEPGIYRIVHGQFDEYVIVNGPHHPVSVTAAEPARDEISVLEDALNRGLSLEELDRNKPSTRAKGLYEKILKIVNDSKIAVDTAQRDARQHLLASAPTEDTVALMTAFVRGKSETVQRAAEWYNNLERGGLLEAVLKSANYEIVPWEQTSAYKELHSQLETAEAVLKANEPLLRTAAAKLVQGIVDEAKEAKESYEKALRLHRENTTYAQKIKSRGIQTIPIYIHSDGKTIYVETPFKSTEGVPQGILQRKIEQFLKSASTQHLGLLQGSTSEGLHCLIAQKDTSHELYAFAQTIVRDQCNEQWFKLGYQLDVLSGPSSIAQQMQLTHEHLAMGTSLEDMLDGKYDLNIRPRLEGLAAQAGIKLPTREEIVQIYKAGKLYETSAGLFAITLIELAGGQESTVAPLARQIAAKYKLEERSVYGFLRIAAIEQRFPTAISIRTEDSTHFLKLNPDYIQSRKTR